MSSPATQQTTRIPDDNLAVSSCNSDAYGFDGQIQYAAGRHMQGSSRQNSPAQRKIQRSVSMQSQDSSFIDWDRDDSALQPSSSGMLSYAGMMNCENSSQFGEYDVRLQESVGVSLRERAVHRVRGKSHSGMKDKVAAVFEETADVVARYAPDQEMQEIYSPQQTAQGYPQLPQPTLPGEDSGGGVGTHNSFSPKKNKPLRASKSQLAYVTLQNSIGALRDQSGDAMCVDGDAKSFFTRQLTVEPPMQLFKREMLYAEQQQCLQPQFRIHPVMQYDVPLLPDDYYLNQLAWEPSPLQAVGFENSVWQLDPPQQQYVHAYDQGKHQISSLSWASKTSQHVGTKQGCVYTVDVEAGRIVRTDRTHGTRVGVLQHAPLDDNLYVSGSYDKTLAVIDTRMRPTTQLHLYPDDAPGVYTDTSEGAAFVLKGHQQEVCGLSWCSTRANYLASGGNDNNVAVWDQRGAHYLARAHTAGIKAVSWKGDTLITAGGLRDKRVIQWRWGVTAEEQVRDAYTNLKGRYSGIDSIGPLRYITEVNTKSQISGVVWAGDIPVTAHGFTRNSIATWSTAPLQMQNIVRMHNKRALYIASDGRARVATGAGDGTVKVFTVGTDKICGNRAFKLRKPMDIKRSSIDSFLKLR